MLTRNHLLFMTLTIALTPPLGAADWTWFATDKAGTLLEVDRSSLLVDKGIVYAWIKRIYPQPKTVGEMQFSTAIMKEGFKCTVPYAVATVQMAFYDSRGKHVGGHAFSPVKFDEPVPDSIGDTTRRLVCDFFATTAAVNEKENKTERQWFAAVESFKRSVRDHEGIDYDTNQMWNDAWDAEIKRLANEPTNREKPAVWFLENAHVNVKRQFAKK